MPGKSSAIGAAHPAKAARPQGPPPGLAKREADDDKVTISSEARKPEAEVEIPDFKEWAGDFDKASREVEKEAREVEKSGNPEAAEKMRESLKVPPGLEKKGGMPPGLARKGAEPAEKAEEIVQMARQQRQARELTREQLSQRKVSEVPQEALAQELGTQTAAKVVQLAQTHPETTVARVVKLGDQACQAADLLAKRPGLKLDELVDRGVNGADSLKPVLTHQPSRELLDKRTDVGADELGTVADKLRQTFSYRGSEVYDKVLHTMGRRPGLAPSTVVLEAARAGRAGASEEERYDVFLSSLGVNVTGVNVGLPVRSYA